MGMKPPADGDLRHQLLEIAERRFAQDGVAETSVRAITSEAGANVAAINYHFGSKEALLREVLERRNGPLWAERRRLLAECEQTGATVEGVLAAFAGPAIRMAFEHPYAALLAKRLRLEGDPGLWRELREQAHESIQAFREALMRLLPDVPPEEVGERLVYVAGASMHMWARVSPSQGATPERALARFIQFFAAGMRAPATRLEAAEAAPAGIGKG